MERAQVSEFQGILSLSLLLLCCTTLGVTYAPAPPRMALAVVCAAFDVFLLAVHKMCRHLGQIGSLHMKRVLSLHASAQRRMPKAEKPRSVPSFPSTTDRGGAGIMPSCLRTRRPSAVFLISLTLLSLSRFAMSFSIRSMNACKSARSTCQDSCITAQASWRTEGNGSLQRKHRLFDARARCSLMPNVHCRCGCVQRASDMPCRA